MRSELEREWIDLENKLCSEFEAQGSNFSDIGVCAEGMSFVLVQERKVSHNREGLCDHLKSRKRAVASQLQVL